MSVQSPQPATYDRLAVHSERPGFCVAHVGPLVVPIWTRTATAEHVELIGEAQRDVLRDHPKFMVLSIIRAALSMSVDDDVRERSRANVDEFGERTVRSVLVVEGGSIRASFFRSVITGVYFLSRSSASQRVFSTIDDGLDWLLESRDAVRLGPSSGPSDGDATAHMRDDVRRFADDVSLRHPPA